MCIRDRFWRPSDDLIFLFGWICRDGSGDDDAAGVGWTYHCLLYTSDAADERSSVDLGGRRIIKKKTWICMHAAAVSTESKKQKLVMTCLTSTRDVEQL